MYTQISMQTVLSNGHCIHTLFPYIHKYEKIFKKNQDKFHLFINQVNKQFIVSKNKYCEFEPR